MQESYKDDQSTVQADASRSSLTKNTLPPDFTVRVIFHGLQCFYFDGKNQCEIGLHNKTHARPGHMHPHNLSVTIWRRVNGGELSLYLPETTLGNPKNVGDIIIGVVEPTNFLDGIYVYEKGAFSRPDTADQNDPNDWRWVVDFERDVYTVPINTKHGDAVRPSVKMMNGLFYTLLKTESKFVLHPDNRNINDNSGDKDLGNVANLIAANIYLKSTGKAILTIGNLQPIELPASLLLQPVTYQIAIMNDCDMKIPACAFDRDSPHVSNRHLGKKERNDFYLYYDTFTKPKDKPEYELIRYARPPRRRSAKSSNELIDEIFSQENIRKRRSTDEAPCGGTTYGQSGRPGGTI